MGDPVRDLGTRGKMTRCPFGVPVQLSNSRSVTRFVAERQYASNQSGTESRKRRCTDFKFLVYRKPKHVLILSSQK